MPVRLKIKPRLLTLLSQLTCRYLQPKAYYIGLRPGSQPAGRIKQALAGVKRPAI